MSSSVTSYETIYYDTGSVGSGQECYKNGVWYYGPKAGTTYAGYGGIRITINATNLKSITFAPHERIFMETPCGTINNSRFSGITYISKTLDYYWKSSIVLSKSSTFTSTSNWLSSKFEFANKTTDPIIAGYTYTFSTPYTGTLYVYYTNPRYNHTSYTTSCIGVKEYPDITLSDADPNVTISATINNVSTYNGYEYINLESTSNKVTGNYTITSQFPDSSSYISIGGTSKATSLTYNSQTNFDYGSISPVAWGTDVLITIYAENTANGYDSWTKRVYLYGKPIGTNYSGDIPIYKKSSTPSVTYTPFEKYGPSSTGLSVSCDIGSVSISSISGSDVSITYTPDTTTLGQRTATITLKDNFTGTEYTATSTFTYKVYNPPEVSFTPVSYTPSYNETVTFVNTSTEVSGVTYKYLWIVDNTQVGSWGNKSNYNYTFNSYGSHTITLKGIDTLNYGDYNSVSHTYEVPSYIPDIVFNDIGNVYVGIPATASIVVDPTKEGIVYTWYFKNHIYDEYVKIQDGGSSCTFTATDTTNSGAYIKVTAEKNGEYKDRELSFLVQEPTPTISFKCYSDAEATTEITSSTPIADSSTKVYLQNNSTPVATTSPTYTWKFNGSEITPVSTIGGLPYFIPSVSATGSYSLELIGAISSYTSSGSMNLTMVSPAPYIESIITSKSSGSLGDTIYCSLDLTETYVGATYTYSWTLDGTPIGTSSSSSIEFTIDSSEEKTYTITATVSVVGAHTTWYSNTETATVNTIEYKDPTKRYTVVIRNGDDALICTRSSLSSNRFNNLQFEKRLNETGSGSFDLLIPNSNSTTVISSGSDVIIYDNVTPIYFGIITDVSDNNILPAFSAASVTKKYFTISFAEGCRKFSYMLSSNSEIITDTCDNIFETIIGSEYVGLTDEESNKYSYQVSYQDKLSQIDSFGEQCGARYRTNIHTYYKYNDAIYVSNHCMRRPSGWSGIETGALLFSKNDKCLIIWRVVSYDGSDTIELFRMNYVGTALDGDTFKISAIKPNPIIDFKKTYYSSETLTPLEINKTCYNVDDTDVLTKKYGTVSCMSPQTNAINIVRKINLRKHINEDYTSNGCGYISECNDTEVVSYDLYTNPTTGLAYWRFIIDGHHVTASEHLYMPYIHNTSFISGYRYLSFENTFSKNVSYVSTSGEVRNGTQVITNYQYNENEPTLVTDGIYSTSLIGIKIPCFHIKVIGNLNITNKVYIAGSEFNVSNVTYGSGYVEFDLAISQGMGFQNMLSFPNGTIVQDDSAIDTNSPYYNYPDKSLSVTLQNGLSYGDVGLMASTICRYGSNFTKTFSGTCSIKVFMNTNGEIPNVGSHGIILYNGNTYDYELQSFTVNTQTMTVDFNMGMKPINIGDVIYRINQNMTTNITTN